MKPKVLKKITDDRAIIVLVGAELKKNKLSELKMQGGGLIKKSPAKVAVRVQRYEDLPGISDYIKEVKVSSDRKEVFIHTEAFKYHARMKMKISPEKVSDTLEKLEFTIIEGNFKGMTGHFTFEKHKPSATLMGFEARYEYKKLPMPQFFLEFGLEFVLQKVAAKMRTYLENEPGV